MKIFDLKLLSSNTDNVSSVMTTCRLFMFYVNDSFNDSIRFSLALLLLVPEQLRRPYGSLSMNTQSSSVGISSEHPVQYSPASLRSLQW
jgi:hypothetical protein